MTNSEIIYREAIAAQLYTPEEAAAIFAERGQLPLHTFQEWKARGFSVKKGEHAALVCQLWKWTNKPTKAMQEAAADALSSASAEEEQCEGHYYRAKAHLFSAAQVRRMEQAQEIPA